MENGGFSVWGGGVPVQEGGQKRGGRGCDAGARGTP